MSEPSLGNFVSSIARSLFEAVRTNKLPAVLSAAAFSLVAVLALTSQYDERPYYRQFILPEIEKAERPFLVLLEAARQTSNGDWRIHYFLSAHGRAKDVLNVANARWPTTRDAVRAHSELIRYYELVNEEFAIIRTEMSLYPDMDYLGEWNSGILRLKPIRERWVEWVR